MASWVFAPYDGGVYIDGEGAPLCLLGAKRSRTFAMYAGMLSVTVFCSRSNRMVKPIYFAPVQSIFISYNSRKAQMSASSVQYLIPKSPTTRAKVVPFVKCRKRHGVEVSW